MIDFLLRIGINAAALIVAAAGVPGSHLSKLGSPGPEWLKVLAVALIFALINTYIRPIVKKLSLPISLLTMGLVGLVINAAMLLLLSYVSGALKLPFKVGVFPPQIDLISEMQQVVDGKSDLEFTVKVEDDKMSGSVKAGSFGSSPLTGVRA